MAVNGTLYTYPENFRAFKALIAAQYSGAKVNVDNNFVFGETNKSDAFLKKFPLGKVPAFETTDGKCIFESNAIAWAVANDQLRGKTAMDQAQVVAWMNFADNEILPASCTWVFPCLGIMQFNKSNTERAKEDIKKALGALNTHLLPRTFLVGERISLADVSVCCTLLHLYQYVLEPSFRKPFQNVNRWFTTVINQPQVKAVIGDFKLCDKMAQFDNKKFAEVQGKIKQGGGEKKQEKKEKKEPKKELPKKEKEPSPAAPAAPKPKDPLDALPAGLDGDKPREQDSKQGSSGSSIPTLIPLVESQSSDGGSSLYDSDTTTYLPVVENVTPRASSSSDIFVPPPVEKVHLKHIESMPKLVVYFDLETTGLEADCDIVQLSSAVGQQYFNQYILPSKKVSWKASEITGLTFDSGSLHLKGKKVEALEPREALQKWLNWIRPLAPVVLVAHNCYNFDARRLVNNYNKFGLLEELGQLVTGFIDTLPMFKELYPKMSSYRQEELVTKILKESYEAHDSLADVQSLQKLVMKHNLSDKKLLKFSFTYQSLLDYIEYSKKGKENAESLKSLINSKHLSSGMAETVGKSGLTLDNLRSAFVDGGKELLEKVLSEPTSSGQPRVTRNRSVLNKLHEFFSNENPEPK